MLMGPRVANSDLGSGFDSVLDYTALETGKYTLHIRDIRYKGGAAVRLSLEHPANYRILRQFFPLVGNAGPRIPSLSPVRILKW